MLPFWALEYVNSLKNLDKFGKIYAIIYTAPLQYLY
jgi:hypothetical protein